VTEVLELEGALVPDLLARTRAAMRAAAGADAGVLGLGEERAPSLARRTTRLGVAGAVRDELLRLLDELRPRLAQHFGRELDACEDPQFLRYVPGDYFVAHQDGNTPLLHDETRFRKVSVVIFVSDPAEFEGGELLLHPRLGERGEPRAIEPVAGKLVSYPAETTHEVTPLTAGERLTVVSWLRGGS
jgi:SM-20-related protein